MAKKILDDNGMKHLWARLKEKFALISHKHTKSDITDFPNLSNYVTTNAEQTISATKTFSAVNYFTGETKFTNAGYCPTFSDIASGIGKASCFTRGAHMQAIVGQIIAGNQNVSNSTYSYDITAGALKFQRITNTGNGAAFTLATMATMDSSGLSVVGSITEDGALLSTKYLSKAGGQMTGPLSFNSNTALPQKTLNYICGIDAFANGGQMGWQSKSEFLSGYALSTHNHDNTYATKANAIKSIALTNGYTTLVATMADGSTVKIGTIDILSADSGLETGGTIGQVLEEHDRMIGTIPKITVTENSDGTVSLEIS